MGANFEQKIETHEDLPAAGVVAVYRQAWADSSVETEFRDDENPKELKELGEALTVK
jgi:plasmid replication initiation protein